ncbi:MAG: type II secretion system F family protein [Proteocatella sp.]
MKNNIKIESKRDFFNMMSFYTESKLGIITSLELIADEIKSIDISTIIKKIRNGENLVKTFSEAGITDEFIKANLEIGESTESYKTAYKTSYRYLDEKSKSLNHIKRLIFYPALLLIMMFFLLLFIILFAIPQLSKVYQSMDVDIPASIKIVMNINGFIDRNAAILKMTVLTTIFLLILNPRKSKLLSKIYALMLKIKIVNRIYSNYYIKEVSWQLYTLMEAEKDILESLNIIKLSINNTYMKMLINDNINEIKSGKKISEACQKNKDFFGTTVIAYLKVGEESGNLAENIKYINLYSQNKLDNIVEILNKACQPTIMIFIGILLAAILMLILPLLDVSSLYAGM